MKATELIDILAPEHGRTTCSDENKSNGYWFDENNTESGELIIKGHARCTRCALFEIVDNKISNIKDFLPF